MNVCVVTCTGERPELFALCQKWVERQSIRPDLWLVSTDAGDTPVGLPHYAAHTRLTTSGPNDALTTMLESVPNDHAVVIMEDDDWYSPFHISAGLSRIALGHMITCQRRAVRFHPPAMLWSGEHDQEGFIQGTVTIHPDFIREYVAMVKAGPLAAPHLEAGRYDTITTIGIKGAGHGLPGRPGFTNAHKRNHYKVTGMMPDPDHKNFIARLGPDAFSYLKLIRP